MKTEKGILITTFRGREDDCAGEAWYIFSELGYTDFWPEKIGMPGIVILKVSFDPIKAVEDLIKYAKDKVWGIRYILKAIPLEIITETDYEKISNAVEVLANKIEENKTYRISVTNRGSSLSSRTIIEKSAEKINRKVDLKNFDYEVIIEILGNISGISILKRDQVFSLHKIREQAIKEISGQ